MRGHSFLLKTFGLNLVKIFILGYIVSLLLDIHIHPCPRVVTQVGWLFGVAVSVCERCVSLYWLVVVFCCVLLYCWVIGSVVCHCISLCFVVSLDGCERCVVVCRDTGPFGVTVSLSVCECCVSLCVVVLSCLCEHCVS